MLASVPPSGTSKVSTCIGCARTGVVLRSRQSNGRKLQHMEKASAATNYPVFRLGGRERGEGNVERCGICCMVMTMLS